MSIVPLPVFEADGDPSHRDAMTDEEVYARLEPPKSMVVRFGRMGMVGEFRYEGDSKPGCGTKLVVRTHRGTEIADMLTTTCDNSGCGKSITRKEMLEYIENSGGRDYPFHVNGRIVRVATVEDLNKWSLQRAETREQVRTAKKHIAELELDMKLVDVEPIFGAELLTFYYMAENRVDFRELLKLLAAAFSTRIEMRQVGARDEARIAADYERCGQHCCCKTFLKVLSPVSMKAAKMQKATLDPLKISGRCGRLMCCLRYEDKTYRELKAALPHRKTRVGTREGPGIVLDGKILVQLVLVRLEHDGRDIAVPVEELMDPETCPKPGEEPIPEPDPLRGLDGKEASERGDDRKRRRRRGRGGRSKQEQQDTYRAKAEGEGPEAARTGEGGKPKKKRRRRRRGEGAKGSAGGAEAASKDAGTPPAPPATGAGPEGDGAPKRKKRRRRRGRRRSGGGQNESGGD